MKNATKLLWLVAIILFVFSCKKTEHFEPLNGSNSFKPTQTFVTEFGNEAVNLHSSRVLSTSNCPTIETTLIAGQTIDAGTISVWNDSSFIYVTYGTKNGWVLAQTHLYVGIVHLFL